MISLTDIPIQSAFVKIKQMIVECKFESWYVFF
jgi:hypothetical protein